MSHRRDRLSIGIAASLLVWLAAAGAALAQDVCGSLQARLSSIDQAIAAQRGSGDASAAYRSLQAMVAAEGCLERRLFRSDWCRGATAELDRLAAVMNGTDSDQLQAQRASIQQQLADNNCAVPVSAGGRYRTLCVRVCDGYYFPISYAATRDQLPTDALICSVRCPGQSVSLYTLRSGEEDVALARSSEGDSYGELATAFAYRSQYESGCGCGPPAASTSALADLLGPERAAEFAASIGLTPPAAAPYSPADPGVVAALAGSAGLPLPLPRPQQSEDPETLANRAGGFGPGSYLQPAVGGPAVAVADGEVRQVGPAYLYYSAPVRAAAPPPAFIPATAPVAPVPAEDVLAAVLN